MKRARFTEDQIIGVLKEHEAVASTFRDWAGDIGDVPRDLAETQLAHTLGATEGAYRRLTAVEKRRTVLANYARWLTGEAESNIIQLKVG